MFVLLSLLGKVLFSSCTKSTRASTAPAAISQPSCAAQRQGIVKCSKGYSRSLLVMMVQAFPQTGWYKKIVRFECTFFWKLPKLGLSFRYKSTCALALLSLLAWTKDLQLQQSEKSRFLYSSKNKIFLQELLRIAAWPCQQLD